MKVWRLFLTPIACFLGLVFAGLIQDLASGPSRYTMWQWMPVSLIALAIPPMVVLAWYLVQNPQPRPVIGFLASAGTFAFVEFLDQAFKMPTGVIAGIFCFLPLLILLLFAAIRSRSGPEGKAP